MMARRPRPVLLSSGLLALLAVPASAAPLPNHTLSWTHLGEPGCGGDITAVRQNPYNASQVFMAGDMLGVGVSLDGGFTWLSPAPDSFLSWEAADFSFCPTLRRVYAATLSGVYAASFDDPLNSWVPLINGLPSANGSGYATYVSLQKVLIDPTSAGQRLLAFGGNKRQWERLGWLGVLWESLDAGKTWTNITTIADGANIVAADWCGPACIWAAASGKGMFQSLDGGKTWALPASAGLPTTSFGSAATHPTDPNTAWVATCDGHGVWRTTDGGATYAAANGVNGSTALHTGGGQCYEAFGNAPTDPNTLYAGNGNDQTVAWVSHDGGSTWATLAPAPSAEAYGLGLGASFLSVSPVNSTTVFYGTWVTLWRTDDGGQSWRDVTAFQPNASDATVWRGTGYSGLVSTNVEFSPFGDRRGVLQGMDAGKIWVDAFPGTAQSLYAWRRQTGLNEFGGGNDVSFAADLTTVYAATGQGGWPSYFSVEGVVKSTDGGSTWSYACGHPNVSNTVEGYSLHVSPYNASTLWAVFQDGRIYVSSDGCLNWTRAETANDTFYNLVAGPMPAGEQDPFQQVLFAAGREGVWARGPGWSNTSALDDWVLLSGGPTAWEYSTNWCTLPAEQASGATPLTTLVCVNGWWDQWHSGIWYGNLTQAQARLRTGSGPDGWDRAITESTAYRWADKPGTGSRVQAWASNLNPYPRVSSASGVYLSVDGGQTWSVQNDGLRMKRVSALAFTPDGSKLIAGLNGGGFYVADVSAL